MKLPCFMFALGHLLMHVSVVWAPLCVLCVNGVAVRAATVFVWS